MSDGTALRAAICANPDDDTARLVYADWLDENNFPGPAGRASSSGGAGPGPNAKRAAFVRARVELTRLETADTPERYLAAYITDSLSSNIDRIDWTAVDPALATQLSEIGRLGKVPGALTRKGEGLPKVRGFAVEGWRRGFYDSVVVYAPERFLAHAAELFRAAPIDRATFEELNAEQARELVASGHLARFRAISFGFDVEPEAVRVLGTHRDAAGVRFIEFDESGTGDHIHALANGKHWTGVRELHLIDLESSDDPPEPEQFAELFARPWCRGVRELVAWGCRLDAGAARALATKCPELRHLDIGMNDIGIAGARALAESKSLRRLAFLDVSACDLESSAVQAALITSPRLQALSVLRAGGNGLAGPTAKALTRDSRGPGLRALELNACSSAAAGALAECPALAGLYLLTFDGGSLDDTAAARFFRRAQLDRLVYLDMAYSGIGVEGAKALAAWPGAARLQWLNLSENAIGAAGVNALIASPHLKNLRHFEATGRGLAKLKKHFGKVMQ